MLLIVHLNLAHIPFGATLLTQLLCVLFLQGKLLNHTNNANASNNIETSLTRASGVLNYTYETDKAERAHISKEVANTPGYVSGMSDQYFHRHGKP